MEPEPFVGDQVNKLEPTFRQKTDFKKSWRKIWKICEFEKKGFFYYKKVK